MSSHHSGRALPSFFIVGHPKCGTTALYEALRSHPEIFMPLLKEPHFLAQELRYRPEWGEDYGGLPRTLHQYLDLFEPAADGQLLGEASACYLWSETAATEIDSLCDRPKVVAVFREPVSLVRSLHLQFVQTHMERETDLRRALSLEPSRREGLDRPSSPRNWEEVLMAAGGLLYADFVRFTEQLSRFEQRFPPENLLVLIYDDFRADNEATIRRILEFLDVDPTAAWEIGAANPTVRVRSRAMNDLLRSVTMGSGPASRTLKRGIKTILPSRKLRRRMVESTRHQILYTEAPPLEEKLAAELRDRFGPEVSALSERLKRDLVSLWGYDNDG
jgi:hypothetical protein